MTDDLAPSGDSDGSGSEIIAPGGSGDAEPEVINRIAHRVMEMIHEVSTVESYSGPLPPAAEFARDVGEVVVQVAADLADVEVFGPGLWCRVQHAQILAVLRWDALVQI